MFLISVKYSTKTSVCAYFHEKCCHSFLSFGGNLYALSVNKDILRPLITLAATEMIIFILNLVLTGQKIFAADKTLQFILMLQ